MYGYQQEGARQSSMGRPHATGLRCNEQTSFSLGSKIRLDVSAQALVRVKRLCDYLTGIWDLQVMAPNGSKEVLFSRYTARWFAIALREERDV